MIKKSSSKDDQKLQAKMIKNFKNAKQKLLKTKAAISFRKR